MLAVTQWPGQASVIPKIQAILTVHRARHRENLLKTTRFRGEALRTKSVVMIFISHILSSVLDHEVYQEHCCAVLIINLVHNTMTIICGWWTLGWSAVSDSIFPSVL